MAIDEEIRGSVQKLPDNMKTEVLDFVEYLLTKIERESTRSDEANWSELSLTLAMSGLENESGPEYTRADLKEIFA
jgi:Protein of unknown function (DUF2281)